MSDGSRAAPARSWVHTGLAQRARFGPGESERAGEVVREVGIRRAMLVTTPGRAASGEGSALRSRLGRLLVSVFDQVRSHVPTTAVEAAVRQAREEDVDGIVSFGGGSCADLGKAVCFFTEQQAGTPGVSYTDRPVVGHVAIPTTYSGAELTPFFGMTDQASGRKSGAGGPTTAPLAVVYDPALTLSTPPRVSAETGMNALAHGVECACSPTRSPEVEAVALAAVSRIATALPSVVGSPGDLEARAAMLEAAFLAGRCLHNAGMGVAHGLSQLVGGRTGIPHGLANAVMLPHAMSFNMDAVPDELERVGRALGDAGDPAGACEALRGRLGLPGRLSEVGVSEEDLDVVARMSQSSPAVMANPRPVSEEDARSILEAAW